MGYVLRQGLSYGINAGRAVFLDRGADRYFCLPDGLNAMLLAAAAERSQLDANPSALLNAGIMREIAGPSALGCVKVLQGEDTLLQPSTAYGWQALSPTALVDRLIIRASLGRASLDRLLGHSNAHLLHERLGRERDEVARIVQDVRSAAKVYGTRDRCLADALIIRRRLKREGYGAALIFGVRLMPFEAHCWLQRGGTILNDYHDHVALFTPVGIA